MAEVGRSNGIGNCSRGVGILVSEPDDDDLRVGPDLDAESFLDGCRGEVVGGIGAEQFECIDHHEFRCCELSLCVLVDDLVDANVRIEHRVCDRSDQEPCLSLVHRRTDFGPKLQPDERADDGETEGEMPTSDEGTAEIAEFDRLVVHQCSRRVRGYCALIDPSTAMSTGSVM